MPDHAWAYTARDTPDIRARIQGDLERVARAVAAADPGLRALVLTGGFSRGEGTARNGKPVNDYDLVAVKRNGSGIGTKRYRALAHQLSDEIGLEVDLLPVSDVWWARAPAKLFWLDAKLGARVLHGDASVIEDLPAHKPGDLLPIEAARLLGNRAAGLLLSLPGGSHSPLDPDTQAAKAVLAAMDATLLDLSLYAPTMRERLSMTRDHADHKLFERAVEWKLHEGAPVAWHEARDALLRAVDATDARSVADGWPERAIYALRARRFAWHPSRDVRRGAWDLLGRAHDAHERARLLARRQATLQ